MLLAAGPAIFLAVLALPQEEARHPSRSFGKPPKRADVTGQIKPPTPPPVYRPLAGPDGDDVQVSTPSNANQNEMTIDVDPVDRDHLIGGANDDRGSDYTCAFYATFDGGLSWNELLFPVPSGGYDAAGDPATAIGPGGEAYFCALAFDRGFAFDGIYIGASPDGGLTVPSWVEAVHSQSGGFEDKEFMAADQTTGPLSGSLYITWTRFQNSFSSSPIYAVASYDQGGSWTTATRVSESNDCQGSCPAVGPNGELYVAWLSYAGQDRIQIDVSHDGGVTFGADVDVANVDGVSGIPHGSFRANSFPSLDVDRSGGPYNGNLYVCWADDQGSHTDILFTRSTNGGNTWSSPVVVNDDATTTSQWFPWLEVDPHGNVNIGFYDRRDDPADRYIGFYVARSSDGGLSFQPNVRVADQAFDPNTYGDGSFLGDYNGLAASDRTVHPLWADGRNNTNDTFTSRVQLDFSGNADSLSAQIGGAVQFTLDPGPLLGATTYHVLGSMTGTDPGLDFGDGVVLPLNFDPFMLFTFMYANTPTFANFTGTLDANGQGQATFDTLGPFDPVFAGLDLSFALLVEQGGQWLWASNPYTISLVN